MKSKKMGALVGAVAEVLHQRTGKSPDEHDRYPRDPQLDDDKLLAQEIFWDLIRLEVDPSGRVLTRA